MIKTSYQKAILLEIELSPAQESYLSALRALSRGGEEETGLLLNQCRRHLLAGRHWTELTDKDMQEIMPDLTVGKFNALYGDTVTTNSGRSEEEIAAARAEAKTMWVRREDQLAMIGAHLQELGTEEDSRQFTGYVLRHSKEVIPAPRRG